MRTSAAITLALVASACGSPETVRTAETVTAPARLAAKLPRAPGQMSPSLVAIEGSGQRDESSDASSTGAMLADVDSCASCHPDVAAQWSSSAHSFASFGNPIYR